MPSKLPLRVWIRRQCYGPEDKRPVRLILRHMPLGGKQGHDVDTVDVPKVPDDTWIEQTESSLMLLAENDAAGFGGVETYVLRGEDEKGKPLARYTFKMSGEEDSEENEGASEPPTSKGLTAQLMRHNEALMRHAVTASQGALNNLSRTLEKVTLQNEALVDKRLETLELIEQLLTQKHEREMEAFQIQENAKVKEKALDAVKPLLPVLMSKLTGQKLLPAGSVEGQGLQAFMESLTPEQVEKIQGTLSQEQMVLLMEIVSQSGSPH